MNKRLWGNLILILLSAALIGLAFYGPTPQDKNWQDLPPLTSLQAEQIQRIRIQKSHHAAMLLQRENNHWRMIKPQQAAANLNRIKQLLRISHTEVVRQLDAQQADLAQLGLQPPLLQLQLNDEKLGFGRTDPIHHLRYVLYQGKINLIRDGFQHHLQAPVSDWQQSTP
ncbi:MAG: hypothetical protein KZQ58_01195 [gamma proteobacterium symbiont of Bathyaustriella thionipta]|nr:hypothetical protein [gamma proteobacterium symbiont of Bathyaustriella thionipta]